MVSTQRANHLLKAWMCPAPPRAPDPPCGYYFGNVARDAAIDNQGPKRGDFVGIQLGLRATSGDVSAPSWNRNWRCIGKGTEVPVQSGSRGSRMRARCLLVPRHLGDPDPAPNLASVRRVVGAISSAVDAGDPPSVLYVSAGTPACNVATPPFLSGSCDGGGAGGGKTRTCKLHSGRQPTPQLTYQKSCRRSILPRWPRARCFRSMQPTDKRSRSHSCAR